MEQEFKYLSNQFEVATRDSYKRAVKLSNYHDAALIAALQANAIFQPLYDRYHPLHLALENQYNLWKSKGGTQEGDTLSVKQLLVLARTKLQPWDVAIQVVYPRTTPRYKAIFPNGRKPFDRGSIDQRINAYNTLSLNIGADAALAAVKAEVDIVYSNLDKARTDQQSAKVTTKISSADLDTATTAAMVMQYRNMAWVLDNLFDSRENMCNAFFDLQTLRQLQQTIFTGTLTPLENEPVLVHTFLSDDEIRLKNDGAIAIEFYLASTSGGKNSVPVTVVPGEEKTVAVSAFAPANYGTHRYLTAYNPSNSAETHYLIELY